jgi:hypothetical protein
VISNSSSVVITPAAKRGMATSQPRALPSLVVSDPLIVVGLSKTLPPSNHGAGQRIITAAVPGLIGGQPCSSSDGLAHFHKRSLRWREAREGVQA